ncbi:MAG TPA: hypothetical protein PJ990_13965 [Saprospiraceae bacterium]|nr:hypothetical protein [Saprospiraceae bacterium]
MNKYENDITHIRQMMERYILLIFLSFSVNFISAQQLTLGYSYTAIVKAKSGINMREDANAASKKILSIPYNSRITIVSYDTSYVEVIENIKGFWMHCNFNNKYGYIFSGFLNIQNCLDGIYFRVLADSILVNNDIFIISCEPYFGFYANKSDQFETEFTVKTVKMISNIEPEHEYLRANIAKIANDKEKPTFILSGLPINKKSIMGRLLNDNMLYPSEILYIGDDKKSDYVAYAKGTTIENSDKSRPNVFSEIEKYQIWIRKIDKGNFEFVNYLAEEMTLNAFNIDSYEGGVWFYWTGDLNNDNIPDIIYKKSTHYAGWDYVLLLSQPEGSKDIYKKVFIGGGSTC